MSDPPFNPFNKIHEFDKSSKGPDTNELREKERQKKLKQNGKVDRTQEFLDALRVIDEIIPLEVNARELQDSIFENKLDFSNTIKTIRKYCDKKGIPLTEPADYKDISDSKNGNKPPRETLNPLSDLERDKDWERIIGEKLYKLSDMIKKVGDDIIKKGYLTKDPSLRQSIALGTDAVIDYINPLFDDKFIGEWRDLFEPIVKRYMHDHNLMEEPEFIRQYRYELDLDSGNIKNLHEFSNKYYLGGNIIERINDVIKISDCIPFFAALFENNRQVRYKQQLERDGKKRIE